MGQDPIPIEDPKIFENLKEFYVRHATAQDVLTICQNNPQLRALHLGSQAIDQLTTQEISKLLSLASWRLSSGLDPTRATFVGNALNSLNNLQIFDVDMSYTSPFQNVTSTLRIQNLTLRSFAGTDDVLDQALLLCQHIHTLNLKICDLSQSQHWKPQLGPFLTQVVLSNCRFDGLELGSLTVTSVSLSGSVNHLKIICPNLETLSLDISRCTHLQLHSDVIKQLDLSNQDFRKLSLLCASLTDLDVSYCKFLEYDGIKHMMGSPPSIPHIETLNISGCSSLDQNQVQDLVLSFSAPVILDGTKISHGLKKLIYGGTSVQSLRLQCPSLESLELHHLYLDALEISGSRLSHLTLSHLNHQLPFQNVIRNLSFNEPALHLKFDDLAFIGEEDIDAIFSTVKVASLEIIKCPVAKLCVSHEHLQYLFFESCSSFKHLAVRGCSELLALHCRWCILDSFSVDNCPVLCDLALSDINSWQLDCPSISSISNLTSRWSFEATCSFSTLASSLTELHLAKAQYLTSQEINSILIKTPALLSLHLNQCSKVTRIDIPDSIMTQLQHLKLSNMRTLSTLKSLSGVELSFPQLSTLHLKRLAIKPDVWIPLAETLTLKDIALDSLKCPQTLNLNLPVCSKLVIESMLKVKTMEINAWNLNWLTTRGLSALAQMTLQHRDLSQLSTFGSAPLQRLSLLTIITPVMPFLHMIAVQCPRIQTLQLCQCNIESEHHLVAFAQKARSLLTVTLTQCTLGPKADAYLQDHEFTLDKAAPFTSDPWLVNFDLCLGNQDESDPQHFPSIMADMNQTVGQLRHRISLKTGFAVNAIKILVFEGKQLQPWTSSLRSALKDYELHLNSPRLNRLVMIAQPSKPSMSPAVATRVHLKSNF